MDFLRGLVKVDRQVQPGPSGNVEACPLKNRSSYRTVPVAKVVIEAIAAHLAQFPAHASDFIFPDEHGQTLNRPVFNKRVWVPAHGAAQLPEATCHDLRHFYASALIRAGLNAKVVADRLGHANAAMTLNVYSHLWPDDEDRSRQAIESLFRRDVPQMRPRKIV